MTLVKFCGLSRPEDIAAANSCHPDFIGFVFWNKSRRFVTVDEAIELSHGLDRSIKRVGVFLNASFEEIVGVAKTGCINRIQLHGSENESFVKRIQSRTGMSVIRAFGIGSAEDVQLAATTEADYIMFDGGTGEGRTFDWSVLENVGRPYFLAGGLNPENVGEAVSRLHPYAVDVSSGIESNGVKDPEKMRLFMEAVGSAE